MDFFKRIMGWFRRREINKQLKLTDSLKLRKRTEATLKLIDHRRFRHYKATTAIGLSVKSRFKNLADIVAETKGINNCLILKQLARRPPDLPKHARDVDRFITLDNGKYINPITGVEEYIAEALAYCKALEGSDTIDYGADNHNLRMTTYLLEEHYALSKALLEISLRCL